MDIEKVINLVNSKKTTVDDICAMLFGDVIRFQDEREEFYLQDLKDQHEAGVLAVDPSEAESFADRIYEKIEIEVCAFVKKYADKAIDDVLDAMNQKRFRTKMGPTNLLVLLTTLKETYEVED